MLKSWRRSSNTHAFLGAIDRSTGRGLGIRPVAEQGEHQAARVADRLLEEETLQVGSIRLGRFSWARGMGPAEPGDIGRGEAKPHPSRREASTALDDDRSGGDWSCVYTSGAQTYTSQQAVLAHAAMSPVARLDSGTGTGQSTRES